MIELGLRLLKNDSDSEGSYEAAPDSEPSGRSSTKSENAWAMTGHARSMELGVHEAHESAAMAHEDAAACYDGDSPHAAAHRDMVMKHKAAAAQFRK